MTLREILSSLDMFSDDLVIVARKDEGWDLEAPAALVAIDEFAGAHDELGDLTYFLEIEVAKEVIDVWRSWRQGRDPSLSERFEAILYYAENDTYIS